MDFSKICRMCLSESELNPIFLDLEDQKRYTADIYVTTGLKVEPDDGLPQKMCASCLTFLNSSLKYRKMCNDNEKQLLKCKTEMKMTKTPNITFVEIAIQDGTKTKRIEKKEIKTEIEVESLTEYDEVTKPKDNLKKTELEEPLRKRRKRKPSDSKTVDEMSENNDSDNCIDKDEIIIYVEEDCTVMKTEEMVLQDVVVARGSARASCRLCRRELCARSLSKHYARAHPAVTLNRIKCELCEKCVTPEKMNRHRKLAHGEGGVRCGVRGEAGEGGGRRGLRCGQCKCEFSSQAELGEHLDSCRLKGAQRKTAQSNKEMRECDVCHMKMQRGSLRTHKEVQHGGLKPVCEHCGLRLGNEFRLREHYRAKHGYDKFKCWRCDFQSAGWRAMQDHERRHLGEKPFVCESCGAKFHAAYLLTQHRQSHRTERPAKCAECPAAFKSTNSLRTHRASCHTRARLQCPQCARVYSCRQYAVKHLRHVHGFRGPVPPLRRLDTPADE